MGWLDRVRGGTGSAQVRADRVPEPVRQALSLGRGERLLAWAVDDRGTTVVASNHHLYAVEDGGAVVLSHPWHLVDAGTWSGEASLLTVTWVDGGRPAQWVLADPMLLPETLRERVQASVVLAQHVVLGERRTARAVIRQDLATGDLVEQVLLGKGVRAGDPGVEEQTQAALDFIKEQVGLA